jgi:hypothetical protein
MRAGLGVPGPEFEVPGVDDDQDSAESQEVAQAATSSRCSRRRATALTATMAAAATPTATAPYNEVTLVPSKKASQGEKLQISFVIGYSLRVWWLVGRPRRADSPGERSWIGFCGSRGW